MINGNQAAQAVARLREQIASQAAQITALQAQLAEARNAAVYTQSIEGEVLHILSRLSELDASHIWEAVGISRMQHNIDVVIRALGPANADAILAMKGE